MGYLTGILSPGELVSAVRAARDAAIKRIVADALMRELDAGDLPHVCLGHGQASSVLCWGASSACSAASAVYTQ